MKAEGICCACGKTIEKAFIYCPWCGHLRIRDKKNDFIDTTSKTYNYSNADSKSETILRIEKKLELLENELNCYCL